MEKYTIKRDGFAPITFTGEQIGSASNEIQQGNRANRWIKVTIYKTQGGRYVVSANRFTCWQGESDHRSASSKATPAEIIEWLRADGGTPDGSLGDVSQEAVEEAAKADQGFAAAWVETVD